MRCNNIILYFTRYHNKFRLLLHKSVIFIQVIFKSDAPSVIHLHQPRTNYALHENGKKKDMNPIAVINELNKNEKKESRIMIII